MISKEIVDEHGPSKQIAHLVFSNHDTTVGIMPIPRNPADFQKIKEIIVRGLGCLGARFT
ncbi:MAG: hypothetical protein GWN86_04770 [Desulfobacterales bacterium]|nr:hypothetical protein [Desulfobacterales bacterium]